jgi:hypothetical protein
VTGRRERKPKQLLDDLKEKRGYCKLKEEALDRTLWRTGFGRDCGPVIRQTAEWMGDKYGAVLEFICEGRIHTHASYYESAQWGCSSAHTQAETLAGQRCNTVQSLYIAGGRRGVTAITVSCPPIQTQTAFRQQGRLLILQGAIRPSVRLSVCPYTSFCSPSPGFPFTPIRGVKKCRWCYRCYPPLLHIMALLRKI